MRGSLVLFAGIMALASCSKDESDPDPTPAPAPTVESMLRISFFFKKGVTPYDLSNLLLDEAGHRVQLNRVRLLISNIRLLNNSGQVLKDYPGTVIKVDRGLGNGIFQELGMTMEGSYARIAFDIGLDDANNGLQPTDFSQPPLNDQTLYQSTILGYKFLELTGIWDSNGDLLLNAADEAINFVPATASMRRSKDMFINHGHSSMGSTIYINVNMLDIFNGINCDVTPNEIGGGPVNAQLMNNLQAAVQL